LLTKINIRIIYL